MSRKQALDVQGIRDRLARAQQEHADAKAALKAAEKVRQEALAEAQNLMGMTTVPTVQEVEAAAAEAATKAEEALAEADRILTGMGL